MTRQTYMDNLDAIKAELCEMAREVDGMLEQAMESLVRRDTKLAEAILRSDDIVDNMNVQIEQECFHLIAMQQPVARHLRLVHAAFNIITDLERIGDHGVDIAKIARKLAASWNGDVPDALITMGKTTQGMLRNLIQAFDTFDLRLIDEIATSTEVHAAFERFEASTLTAMQAGDVSLVAANYLLFVAYHLDEMANHVSCVAERLRFYETGESRRLPMAA